MGTMSEKSEEQKAKRRAYEREYSRSERGKAARMRYRQSVKGKNARIRREGAEGYADRILRSLPEGTDLY